MYTLYVCPKCNWGQLHPLRYCIKCPTKLIVKKLEAPKDLSSKTFPTYDDYLKYICDHGCNYEGEFTYEKSPELQKILSKLDSITEKINNTILEITQTADLEILKKLYQRLTLLEHRQLELKIRLNKLERNLDE